MSIFWKRIFNERNRSRFITAIIVLLIAFSVMAITSYANAAGRYIGLSLYMLGGMWALFEFFTVIKISRNVAIITSLILVPFVILGLHDWMFFFGNNTWVKSDILILINEAFGGMSHSWLIYIIILLGAFLPAALDSHFHDMWRNARSQWLIKTGIVFVILLVTSVFIKFFWIANAFSFLLVTFFVFIAIIADTVGYFAGSLLGKKFLANYKFTPKLSPNKTWAGFLIGFLFTAIFAIFYGYFNNIWVVFEHNELLLAIIFGVLLSLVAPAGDLSFSAVKRFAKAKDYSALLPGHGGIFDRIDSLIFVTVSALVFYTFAL